MEILEILVECLGGLETPENCYIRLEEIGGGGRRADIIVSDHAAYTVANVKNNTLLEKDLLTYNMCHSILIMLEASLLGGVHRWGIQMGLIRVE